MAIENAGTIACGRRRWRASAACPAARPPHSLPIQPQPGMRSAMCGGGARAAWGKREGAHTCCSPRDAQASRQANTAKAFIVDDVVTRTKRTSGGMGGCVAAFGA